MPDRNSFLLCKALFALAACLLLADDALAYVIPGPEFAGQFMSLVMWMLVAFSSVMLYPLHALLRRFRRRAPTPAEPTPTPPA